jgi:hypothetical protein
MSIIYVTLICPQQPITEDEKMRKANFIGSILTNVKIEVQYVKIGKGGGATQE